MQTFLPYPDFAQSAKVLDNKRLGKQRIEAKQILEINLMLTHQNDYVVCNKCNVIYDRDEQPNINEHNHFPDGHVLDLLSYRRVEEKYTSRKPLILAWENHPAVLMWRGYELALAEYGIAICKEWISRGFKDNQLEFFEDNCLENDEDYSIKYPYWLGNPKLHLSHQSNLLRKDWDYYIKYFGENIQDTTLPYYWPVKKEK